ncbi:MAG: PaaI family thioesterase [FCB group bacterium]|nr:PaaI family thioesterase [FCB group bacterium]
MLHGGIISTLMDEAMAYAVSSVAGEAATVELNVKFKKPVVCGKEVLVEAEVVEHKKRLIRLKATLTQNGETKASATATFLAV